MKLLTSFLALFLFAVCTPLAAQTTFEEMEFEADSVRVPYKTAGKNYVFVRSKKAPVVLTKHPLPMPFCLQKSQRLYWYLQN